MKGFEGQGVEGAELKQNVLWMPNLRKAISPTPVKYSPIANDNLEPHMSSPQVPKVQRNTSELPSTLLCFPWNSAVPLSQNKISKALEMQLLSFRKHKRSSKHRCYLNLISACDSLFKHITIVKILGLKY